MINIWGNNCVISWTEIFGVCVCVCVCGGGGGERFDEVLNGEVRPLGATPYSIMNVPFLRKTIAL